MADKTPNSVATRLRKSLKWDGLLLDEAAAELDRLDKIETAARNLVVQKGRHNTQQAYERLAALLARRDPPSQEQAT